MTRWKKIHLEFTSNRQKFTSFSSNSPQNESPSKFTSFSLRFHFVFTSFSLRFHTSFSHLVFTPRFHPLVTSFSPSKKLFIFVRGQKRVWDKGREKGLFQKTTPIKLIHVPNNLENRVFPKMWDFDGNLLIRSHFYRKPKWSVRSTRTTFMRY